MTSREKILNALNHEAGPVPMDFGATPITGMHCTCVAALRDHYGLEKRPVKIHDPYQMRALLEDDQLGAVGRRLRPVRQDKPALLVPGLYLPEHTVLLPGVA